MVPRCRSERISRHSAPRGDVGGNAAVLHKERRFRGTLLPDRRPQRRRRRSHLGMVVLSRVGLTCVQMVRKAEEQHFFTSYRWGGSLPDLVSVVLRFNLSATYSLFLESVYLIEGYIVSINVENVDVCIIRSTRMFVTTTAARFV